MIYSIFIPGRTGADKSHLAAVGLADLFRSGDAAAVCADVLAGPRGQTGQIWTWQEGTNIAAYQPDRQQWEPCTADPTAGLAAGRFWWGFTDGPVTELDLQRKSAVKGKSIELRGESWVVPNVAFLPQVFGFDAAGVVMKCADPEFKQFVADCEWAGKVLKGESVPDWKLELEVAVRILAVNYRINLELAVRLDLLTPDILTSVILRAMDQQELLAITV